MAAAASRYTTALEKRGQPLGVGFMSVPLNGFMNDEMLINVEMLTNEFNVNGSVNIYASACGALRNDVGL